MPRNCTINTDLLTVLLLTICNTSIWPTESSGPNYLRYKYLIYWQTTSTYLHYKYLTYRQSCSHIFALQGFDLLIILFVTFVIINIGPSDSPDPTYLHFKAFDLLRVLFLRIRNTRIWFTYCFVSICTLSIWDTDSPTPTYFHYKHLTYWLYCSYVFPIQAFDILTVLPVRVCTTKIWPTDSSAPNYWHLQEFDLLAVMVLLVCTINL
jgi:hypothetical protein